MKNIIQQHAITIIALIRILLFNLFAFYLLTFAYTKKVNVSIIRKVRLQKTSKLITIYILSIAFIISLLWWILRFNINPIKVFMLLFDNLSFNLILLSYLIISVPTAYFIQYLLQKFQINYHDKRSFSEDKNGFWIGVFERTILLTFIYLKQYDAIGFILTGKSFLRIVKENEAKKSEYILLGSMISFSIALIVGLFLQQVI